MAQTNTKECAEILEVWADFLTRPELSRDLVCGCLLETAALDYSVESLLALDRYFDIASPTLRTCTDGLRTFTRCGAYVGEVIRRASPPERAVWLTYDDAYSLRRGCVEPETRANFVCLRLRQKALCYPYQKIMSRVINGMEDGLYSYAKFISDLQNLPDTELKRFWSDVKSSAGKFRKATLWVP